MKKYGLIWVVMALAVVVNAQTFTDVDTIQHQGKTGLKDLVTVIDANFASLEAASMASCDVSIATNANGGTNVVTFTAKDIKGTTMTGRTTMMFYVADSAYGAPAAVAGDIVISGTGAAELGYFLDKGFYIVSMSNGTCVATITDTPGGTNYIHVINSQGAIGTPVKSAFNIP